MHKFAAGHRYLSYRFPSAEEQQRMLECLLRDGGEAEVLREFERDLADGAFAPPIAYMAFIRFAAGELHCLARQCKGLDRPAIVDVAETLMIAPTSSPASDWRGWNYIGSSGPFRWFGRIRSPLRWLPVRVDGAFHITVVRSSGTQAFATLALE